LPTCIYILSHHKDTKFTKALCLFCKNTSALIYALFSDLVFYTFTACCIVQYAFWLFVFSRLAFYKEENINFPDMNFPKVTNFWKVAPPVESPISQYPNIPISVVICARNEAANLLEHLPKILSQNYPDFEVVVVNDASTDNTGGVLKSFQEMYPHLRVINVIEKTLAGKKGALAAGIEATKNDWLLLTDADCYPLSNNWISGMVSGIISKKIQIVFGYAPYVKCDNSFLNKLIRFETLWTATQYLSFALIKQPYMGVGRNLLYEKKLYVQANGFAAHADLASGDDDLFVNQVVTQKNFSLILHSETYMYSMPKTTWNSYFLQKTRHFSVGTRYLFKHKVLLGMVSMSHLFLNVTAFYLLYSNISTMFAATNVVARICIITFLYVKISKRLREPFSFWAFPILDIIYMCFYIIFAPSLILRTSSINWSRYP
jgi:poly-beta-1,6-N-acetyl-D-glucosamine synthase